MKNFIISRCLATYGRSGKMRFLPTALTVALAGCGLSGTQPIGFQDQIAVGEQFIQAGQFKSAYAILDGISENQKSQPKAHLAVGDSYLRANALLRAETAYKAAADLGDKHLAEIGLGKVALKRNNAEGALFHFRNALARDDKSVAAWNGLGVAQDLARNHHEAQNSYRQAIALEPGSFDAINNLGLSQILSGNSASAIETLTSLTESRLDSATTRMNLAIAMHIAGYQQQAAELADTEMPGNEAKQIFSAVTAYVRQSS
jgi:Tfp pilus assembly protein PilF